MNQKENRSYTFRDLRMVDDNGGEKIIEGHAAVFETVTNISGTFYEVIERGAFEGCDLSEVVLLLNHDHRSLPLAKTQSGTLILSIDNVGLAIRAKLDVENNPDARALYHSIKRGDISGMSFAFQVGKDEWQNLESEMPTRIIKQIKAVFDVSAATNPAYPTTDVQVARAAIMTLENALANVRNSPAYKQELAKLKNEIKEKYDMPKKEERMNYETAGKDLRTSYTGCESPYNVFGELRAVTVAPPAGSAATITVPTYSGVTVQPQFPCVSSLIDSVTHLSLKGGYSFKAPFVEGFDDAYYTDEAANAAVMNARFSYAELNQCKITAYTELTEELEKLPNTAYAETIFQLVRNAIRKAVTKEILFGKGMSENRQSRIVGIFSDRATAIDPATDISVSQITDTLLEDILSHYGGDTEVETAATLFLSRADLMAFSKVRSSVKSKIHDIVYTSGNTGRIDGIPFIIDSNLKAISDVETQSGDWVMAFGNPKNYTLVEFSPLTVEKSVHYKFPRGLICFRGTAWGTGNVTKRNGFLRIRKA